MYLYRTYFKLLYDVNNFEEAKAFLKNKTMKLYMKGDSRISKDVYTSIETIQWILKDTDNGIIDLRTTKELSKDELENISDWVCGQCSDGIGEAFEQQPFAHYEEENFNFNEDDDYDDEDNYVMASFDWKTNNYEFVLISTNV